MIGAGYVGLVSAACFSEFGWNVTCTDKDADKIEQLRRGSVPVYEPRLEELLERNLRNGRISFSTELALAVATPISYSLPSARRYVVATAMPISPSSSKQSRSLRPISTAS